MENEDELLAEFMGGTKMVVDNEKLYGYHPGTILWHGLFGESGPVTYLCFDTDWVWLMSVVDKIDKLVLPDGTYFRTNINGSKGSNHCHIYKYQPGMSIGQKVSEGNDNSKLNSVYVAAVEFVRWYELINKNETSTDV